MKLPTLPVILIVIIAVSSIGLTTAVLAFPDKLGVAFADENADNLPIYEQKVCDPVCENIEDELPINEPVKTVDEFGARTVSFVVNNFKGFGEDEVISVRGIYHDDSDVSFAIPACVPDPNDTEVAIIEGYHLQLHPRYYLSDIDDPSIRLKVQAIDEEIVVYRKSVDTSLTPQIPDGKEVIITGTVKQFNTAVSYCSNDLGESAYLSYTTEYNGVKIKVNETLFEALKLLSFW